MGKERKGCFGEGVPGTDPVGTGPVAQGIRARGYEPRCRGFESLLAHNRRTRSHLGQTGPGRAMVNQGPFGLFSPPDALALLQAAEMDSFALKLRPEY